MYTERQDFHLLIKLSYAPSYITDGDEPLDRATLIRLASLANAYEFHDAVKECLTAAGDGLSFQEAITCINDLPENLKGTNTADGLIEKVVGALVKGLNDPFSIVGIGQKEAKEEMLEKGADALASYLGPVSGFFSAGLSRKTWPSFSGALTLKKRIKVSRAFLCKRFTLQVRVE